ncbi:MAG: hypothetical protein H6510_11250 [Acidobacteria bacterium]|nr:hypothetical protein [Acidobacteriota bacterium]MCB9398381.1 hypothetical protein [Acidobacteriota bacterium]
MKKLTGTLKWIVLMGLMVPGLMAQIKGGSEGSKDTLVIQSVTPGTVDVDPDGVGDIQVVFQFLHKQIFNPNPTEYVWQWQSGEKYWDGAAWSSTVSWQRIHSNAMAFWGPSYIAGNTAVFALPRATFPESFFGGMAIDGGPSLNKTVQVKLGYYRSPTNLEQSAPVNVYFGSPNPSVIAFEPNPETWVVYPGTSEAMQLKLPYQVTHQSQVPLANVAWRWQDAATGQYWTGSAWSSTPTVVYPSGNNAGLFANDTIDVNAIELAVTPSQFSTGFWNGADKQIRISVGYLWQGSMIWSAPVRLNVKLGPPPTPTGLMGGDTVTSATPNIRWWSVPAAESYRIGLMKPDGSFLNPTWSTQVITGTSYRPPAMTPNVTYRVMLYSANRAGLSAQAHQGQRTYVKAAPTAPANINPTGSISNPQPTFSWAASVGATSYRLGLRAPDGSWFNPNWQDEVISGTSYALPSPLRQQVPYDIFLSAHNEIGSSPALKVGSVTVQEQGMMRIEKINDVPEQVTFRVDPNGTGPARLKVTGVMTGTAVVSDYSKIRFSWKLRGSDASHPIYWNGSRWEEVWSNNPNRPVEPIWITKTGSLSYPFFTTGMGIRVIYGSCPNTNPGCDKDWTFEFNWSDWATLSSWPEFWGAGPSGIDVQLSYQDSTNVWVESDVFPVLFEYPEAINLYVPPTTLVGNSPAPLNLVFDDRGRTNVVNWAFAFQDEETGQYWNGSTWQTAAAWQGFNATASWYSKTLNFNGTNSTLNLTLNNPKNLVSGSGRPERGIRVMLRNTESPTLLSSTAQVSRFVLTDPFTAGLGVTNFGHAAMDASLGRVLPDPQTGLPSRQFQQTVIYSSSSGLAMSKVYLNLELVHEETDGSLVTLRFKAVPLTNLTATLGNGSYDLSRWFGSPTGLVESDLPYRVYAYLSEQPNSQVVYVPPAGNTMSALMNGQNLLLSQVDEASIRAGAVAFYYRSHSLFEGSNPLLQQMVPTAREFRAYNGGYAANVGDRLHDATNYGSQAPAQYGWEVRIGANLKGQSQGPVNTDLELTASLVTSPTQQDIQVIRKRWDGYGMPASATSIIKSYRDFAPTRNYFHMEFQGGDQVNLIYNSKKLTANASEASIDYACFSKTSGQSFGLRLLGFTPNPVWNELENIKGITTQLGFKYRFRAQFPSNQYWILGDSSRSGFWDGFGLSASPFETRFHENGLVEFPKCQTNYLTELKNIWAGDGSRDFYGRDDEGAILQLMGLQDDRSGRRYMYNASPNDHEGPYTVWLRYNGNPQGQENPCDWAPNDAEISLAEVGWPFNYVSPPTTINGCSWLWDACGVPQIFPLQHRVEFPLTSSTFANLRVTPRFRQEDLAFYEAENPGSWYMVAEFEVNGNPKIRAVNANTPVNGTPINLDFENLNRWISSTCGGWEKFFYTHHWVSCEPGDAPPIDWLENTEYNLKIRFVKWDPNLSPDPLYNAPALCQTKVASRVVFNGSSVYMPLQTLVVNPNPNTVVVDSTLSSPMNLSLNLTPNPLAPNPALTENRFAWLWEDVETGKKWNGTSWVSSYLGSNFPYNSSSSFFYGSTFQASPQPRIVVGIPQNEFTNAFWVDRNQVSLRLTVKYNVFGDGSRWINASCGVTIVKPGVLPTALTSFSLTASPSALSINPSVNDPVSLNLEMGNLAPSNVVLDPARIQWRWKQGSQYWNGSSWDSNAAFRSPGFFMAQR